MSHFDRINRRIETSSRKFLADIELWRKKHFHQLKHIVDEYGVEEPVEWLNQLQAWAIEANIWPTQNDPQHRLKRCPAHWQTRAFVWTSQLKIELSKLMHERVKLTQQRLSVYKTLELRYGSQLPELLQQIQTRNLELFNLNIDIPPKYHRALDIRKELDILNTQLSDEITLTEKPLDLMMGDSNKLGVSNTLLKIRFEMDENMSSISLTKRYLDWAAQEPYIAEVIRYLDKADAIMTHIMSQLDKS